MKMYKCAHCGNVSIKLVDKNVPLVCCGEPMQELKAGVTDAAVEKHVPSFKLDGNTLNVVIGDVVHPMTDEHYIQLILVEQDNKVQYVTLTSDMEPKASFTIDSNKPFTVYEYCNLHGLWKAEK